MFKPYAKEWAIYRSDKISKVRKAPSLKTFEDELAKYNINALHIDVVDRKNLNSYVGTFVYTEGTPNFEHFICSKRAAYAPISGMGWSDSIGTYNPFEYRYKNYDIDTDILNIYKKCNNNKFNIVKADPDLSELPDKFDLFALQQPTSVDRNITQDALKYATNNKRHVVFSTHPSSNNGTDETIKADWEKFRRLGLLSEYTHLVKGVNTNKLIKSSSRVFSACSGVNFLAILNRKPTVSYRNMPWSEISPVIKNATEDFTDWIPEEKDLLRFLSWYYYELSTDITVNGWQEKLCKKLRT